MKASKLVSMIQKQIEDQGDYDIMMIQQTGPDSFMLEPVKNVTVGVAERDSSKAKLCMIIE